MDNTNINLHNLLDNLRAGLETLQDYNHECEHVEAYRLQLTVELDTLLEGLQSFVSFNEQVPDTTRQALIHSMLRDHYGYEHPGHIKALEDYAALLGGLLRVDGDVLADLRSSAVRVVDRGDD